MGGLKIRKKFQMTLMNIIKRKYSWANVKVQREYKKINTLMHYIQACIDEEYEKNKNLLCFNNVSYQQNNYHMLFYIHMLRISYLLKNMTVNEYKWLYIYRKMTTLYFLDEQNFLIKQKEKDHKKKDHKEKDYKDKDHKDKDHKEKDYKDKDHKEKDYKEKDYKDKDHKEKDHKKKDHKEKDYKEKDYKEKDYKEKDHKKKDHKEKDHKEKDYKEKDHKKKDHKEKDYKEIYYKEKDYKEKDYKEKDYNEKNILNYHINARDNKMKSNIPINNDMENIPPHTIERKIRDKYNLFTLHSNYIFVYETILNKIYNYLCIYNIDDMLLLLNTCDRFFHIFFTIHNNKHKRMNKLNYIYIYSNEYNYIHNNNYNNNYSYNLKIRKNGDDNIYKQRSNHKDIFINQYEDIYYLKYHQIFMNIINLMTNILDTINYKILNPVQLIELINIFYRITKKGIINEKHIIKLFHDFIQIYKDIQFIYTYNDIIFKIINIMYISKIINYNIIFPIVIQLKNRNISKYPMDKYIFFEIYLKLLTLINIKPYNLYLYNYCKQYILTNIYHMHPSKVYNFFYISNILGIYNFSIISIYIDYIFKRKNSHLNISSTHKIYYTLLAWNIIYNTILKNKYKHNERNIKIILINFNNKNIHYIYDNKYLHTKYDYDYDYLFMRLKYLLYFYRNKLIYFKEKKKQKTTKNNNKINNTDRKHNNDSNYSTHNNNNNDNSTYIPLNNNIHNMHTAKENYQFNQYSIFSILKEYFPNIINEYTTNDLISLDIFLHINKQYSCKKVALEFNGRTHYNLLINKKTSYKEIYQQKYQMVENYNTKYKKWLLSNYAFHIIYIPYYKWNILTHKQKEKYLLKAIYSCCDLKGNIHTS
ncbi:RAP protein, putative [Plasmodium sp. gorilla clade G3]|nr:RAP protein, putative [Plasmodium sp. gorilla clade G3]